MTPGTLRSTTNKILVFIGCSLRLFFINIAANFVYLFAAAVVTTAVFFLCFRVLQKGYLFLFFLPVLLIANRKIRFFLFFKNQLRMNLMFLDFPDNSTGCDFQQVQLPAQPGAAVKKVRKNIKKAPHKLVLALTALQIKEGETGQLKAAGNLRPAYVYAYRYSFLQLLVFFILALPFALISFFFTKGMGVPGTLVYLIYLLGFFFAYFLNAALVEPIVSLMLQEEVSKSRQR